MHKPLTWYKILCVTSWWLDERGAKSKFVAQSRPALYYSTIHNNNLNTHGEELETARRVFVSNIYRIIEERCTCTSIKNHQNNLLFSYYKLGCRLFELNLVHIALI